MSKRKRKSILKKICLAFKIGNLKAIDEIGSKIKIWIFATKKRLFQKIDYIEGALNNKSSLRKLRMETFLK